MTEKTEKTVLIVQGGWDGHEPQLTSKRFARLMEKHGYTCTISDTLSVLDDAEALLKLDLIVACWTMGDHRPRVPCRTSPAPWARAWAWPAVTAACATPSAQDTEWQFMTGGQWVSSSRRRRHRTTW